MKEKPSQKISRWFAGRFETARNWFDRYERRVTSIALVGGFIFDYLTLTRIDQLYDNLVIIFYLLIAAGSITFIHLYESWTFHRYVKPDGRLDKLCGWVHLASPTVLQFAFGGLFSAFVIFYSRSATLIGSWPFLLILITLLVGNEFFKKRYARLTFQVSVFFFAVYSYAIFAVPILVGTIVWWTFLLSGALTLLLILGFLYILSRLIPTRFSQSQKFVLTSISIIFISINALYNLNVIPPIPLSLKEAGIYHHVVREGEEYVAQREPPEWYDYIRPGHVVSAQSGSSIYAFSSVFAPTDLKADIVHVWQYWNQTERQWQTRNKTQFPVIGGRDSGFRGYSYTTNLSEGDWRVLITTPGGRIIGKIDFEFIEVEDRPETEEIVL